jgi:hypothetical protein
VLVLATRTPTLGPVERAGVAFGRECGALGDVSERMIEFAVSVYHALPEAKATHLASCGVLCYGMWLVADVVYKVAIASLGTFERACVIWLAGVSGVQGGDFKSVDASWHFDITKYLKTP